MKKVVMFTLKSGPPKKNGAAGGELTDRYNPRVFTSRERSFGPPCLDAFHVWSMGGYELFK